MLYEKLPLRVEAYQWDGTEQTMKDLMAWSEGAVDGFYKPEPRISVKTLEGEQFKIPVGSWIVRGVQGEYYPIDEEIFAETYIKIPG